MERLLVQLQKAVQFAAKKGAYLALKSGACAFALGGVISTWLIYWSNGVFVVRRGVFVGRGMERGGETETGETYVA